MKRSCWLCAWFLVVAALASPGADFAIPAIRQPLMRPPAIDGRVDAAEWAGAVRMEGLGRGPKLAPLPAGFHVGCDGTNLYVALVSATPPGGRLLARVAPLPDERDARTWIDDSVELVIDPTPEAPAGARRLLHANFNANGAVHDTAYVVGGNAEAWRGAWRTASQILGETWHFEAAIPLADLGVKAWREGQTMGVRIGRNWHRTPVAGQTEWSPRGGAYLNPDTIPQVAWDSAAPVVQALAPTPGARPGLQLTIANPGGAPLAVRAFARHTLAGAPPAERLERLDIPPRTTVPFALEAPAGTGEAYTLVRVSSADDRTVHYLREYRWDAVVPEPLWQTDEQAARRVETQFAYFPSFDTIHFTVDVNGLDQRDQVTGATLSLRRRGDSAEVIASTNLPAFNAGRVDLWWRVPPLGEGDYAAELALAGVSTDPVVHPFVRHVFPWEGNALGRSDVVLEPFTPIAMQGRRLGTVLREHTLDALGLWDQVAALDKPLLKSPMRLEARRGDRAIPIKGGALEIVETRPTRVVTESRWADAGLRGTARGEWDYDGMLLWTLELEPSAEPLDALTLVVPLDDALAPLMHACTDGTRFNYAGATPAGEGRIWHSGQAPRNSIVGNYVPYIWLGAEERGLAVFGENDRGWINGTNAPCQEIVRRGGVLELRLNLIARPTVIEAPRRIRIGFQATPIKPMPARWRQWAVSWATPVPEGGRKIAFLGSCWYWGTLTPCLDVYPRNEDFSLWDEFKKTRETGQVDPAFLDAWLKGYPADAPDEPEAFRTHVNAGFHAMKGRPTDVLPYTNARGVRFDTREGQTFLDEWHRDPFTTRSWPLGGGVAYDLNPGESFRDYALWHYQKMFSTFADHIYWDDVFLQANFDLLGSDAYALSDGTIQPASGLLDMRELVRRTAVLGHEMGGGRGKANQLHMTNTALAPILAFGYTMLTWEDHAGDRDFQDRFSRDYIRAESLGRAFGVVPFALQLIKTADPVREAWIQRTMAGVMLTHEIRPINAIPVHEACIKTLYEHGYGDPDVTVHNYWQKEAPVAFSRDDISHLVATKPGSALVVVCDYGEGGPVRVKPDRRRLGIAGELTARNAETGEALPVDADGAALLELKKHDFAILRLEGGRP